MERRLEIEKPSAKKEQAFLRLMAAVESGDTLTVSQMAKDQQTFRPLVHTVSYIGSTPLTAAAVHGSMEMLKLILPFVEKSDGSLDVQDGYGRTALSLAAMNGLVDAVSMLIGKGADPNIKDYANKDTLRHAQDFLIRNGMPTSIKEGEGYDSLTQEQLRLLIALEGPAPAKSALSRIGEIFSRWQRLLPLQRDDGPGAQSRAT